MFCSVLVCCCYYQDLAGQLSAVIWFIISLEINKFFVNLFVITQHVVREAWYPYLQHMDLSNHCPDHRTMARHSGEDVFFSMPSLSQDVWTLYNHELNTLLGLLHYDIASESITPAEGGEQFIALVQDFLSSKQEFAMKRNGQAGYIKHASNTLKKARSVKNALRKKAFGSNATDENRKAFRQAVKAHNYLKRMDDNKRKSRTSRHHEKQYHKNFWKFSKQCVNGNIGQSNVSPTFDANLANQYFPQKYSTPNPIVIDNLSWFPHLPVQLDARIGFNLDPVRQRDIRLILKNKKATSAPGPDGLMYGIFRKLPATHRFLAKLFSKLLVTGDPPRSWSKSEVTLIHKAGDTDKPENFRMISLTSCVGKLFHQILSDRIANYFLRNKLIDPETQKAFLKGINGCMEHTFVMNELLANARNKKRTLHATFFDLADAFGSVEHNLIHYTMKRNRIPDPVCLYVENLYSRLEGEIRGPGWRSDPFSFRRGVFQGDPLSPIIFLIELPPLSPPNLIHISSWGMTPLCHVKIPCLWMEMTVFMYISCMLVNQ